MEMINVLSCLSWCLQDWATAAGRRVARAAPGTSSPATTSSWSTPTSRYHRVDSREYSIYLLWWLLQEDYRIMTLLREKQGILDPSPTKHTAVLFVNVKVEINLFNDLFFVSRKMFYYSWFSFNKKYLVLKRKYLRQGCGYPPSVNCTTWIARFGAVGSTFPCHYARTNQSLAITHLDTQVGCDWWRADHVTPTRRRTCGTCWCPPASPSPPASSPGSPSAWCTLREHSY